MHLPKKIFSALITYKTNAQAFDLEWPLKADEAISLDDEKANVLYEQVLHTYLQLQRCIEKRLLVKEYYESMNQSKPSYLFPIQRAIEQKEHAEFLMRVIVQRMRDLQKEAIYKSSREQPVDTMTNHRDKVLMKKNKKKDTPFLVAENIQEDDEYWSAHLNEVKTAMQKKMDVWDNIVQHTLTIVLESFSTKEHEDLLNRIDEWIFSFLYLMSALIKRRQYSLDSREDIIAIQQYIYQDTEIQATLAASLRSVDHNVVENDEATKQDIVRTVMKESNTLLQNGISPFALQTAMLRLLPISYGLKEMFDGVMPMWILWLQNRMVIMPGDETLTESDRSCWKKRYLRAYTKRLPSFFQGNITKHADKMEVLWRKFTGYDKDGHEMIPAKLWKEMYTHALDNHILICWGAFIATQFDEQRFIFY